MWLPGRVLGDPGQERGGARRERTGPKSHQSFKAKNSLPFPLLSDEDHEMSKRYGVWGEKRFMGMLITNRSHFVIGPDGKLEDVQIGVSPGDSVRLALDKIRG
jgi:thioredoxin-dependent peroxiredoxin